MARQSKTLSSEAVRSTSLRSKAKISSKINKTESVKAPTARPVQEYSLQGGEIWKMSGKNGVAYIKSAELAGIILAIDIKSLPKRAMAVYYDKKGKPFAWQVRFDLDQWEEVAKRLK